MVWHPILSALETSPGHSQMLDGSDQPHALIQIVRRGTRSGIKPSRGDKPNSFENHGLISLNWV